MTVIRVARKPAETGSKLANLSLLVASNVANMSTEALQQIAGQAPGAVQVKEVRIRKNLRKGGVRKVRTFNTTYTKSQRSMINNTLRWLGGLREPIARERIALVSQGVGASIRNLAAVNVHVSTLGSGDGINSAGLDTETGALVSEIIQRSAATHFANEFGNPASYKKLRKLVLANSNAWTSELEQFIVKAHSLSGDAGALAKAEEKSVLENENFLNLKDNIYQHLTQFAGEKRAEKLFQARKNRSSRNAQNIMDTLSQFTGFRRSAVGGKKEISAGQWKRHHGAVVKGYKSLALSRRRVLEFAFKQAQHWTLHEDQLNWLAASASITKAYYNSMDFSDNITKDTVKSAKMWEVAAEAAFPRVAKSTKNIGKINLPESLQSLYETWLGATEAPVTNPIKLLTDRKAKIEELGQDVKYQPAPGKDFRLSPEWMVDAPIEEIRNLLNEPRYKSLKVAELAKQAWAMKHEPLMTGEKVEWRKCNDRLFQNLVVGRLTANGATAAEL